ncbi:hypothetical protein [Rubrivirga sp.]|uniref:hypothetical protein n=1 Tax=Rubrivirga sp. TaxID=1885344 RepID=UPI003B519C4F
MPRWTSLLACLVVALVGVAAVAWTEAPVTVEAHETAPAEAEPTPSEEAAVHTDTRAVSPAGARAVVPAEGWRHTGDVIPPPVPPPR